MIKKLLNKIIEIIKKNLLFLITFFIIVLIFTFEFPYYIETPGGIINVSDRFEISNSNHTYKGSINMAYVSELKATISTLLIAKINKDWDVVSSEEVVNSNETEEDMYFRNKLFLEEANNNAIKVAYRLANKEINIVSSELYVTYIDKIADTNLKIGDQIIKINDEEITSRDQIYNIIDSNPIGSELKITVKNNNKTINRVATIVEYEDNSLIGIILTAKEKLSTNPNISVEFESSESGPSGGLMLSLAIYSELTGNDLTNGLKIVGTGTISDTGDVGEISGVKYKLKGAIKNNADIFIVPNGDNYKEAIKIKNENNYNIKILGVDSISEVINYLEKK